MSNARRDHDHDHSHNHSHDLNHDHGHGGHDHPHIDDHASLVVEDDAGNLEGQHLIDALQSLLATKGLERFRLQGEAVGQRQKRRCRTEDQGR